MYVGLINQRIFLYYTSVNFILSFTDWEILVSLTNGEFHVNFIIMSF